MMYFCSLRMIARSKALVMLLPERLYRAVNAAMVASQKATQASQNLIVPQKEQSIELITVHSADRLQADRFHPTRTTYNIMTSSFNQLPIKLYGTMHMRVMPVAGSNLFFYLDT
jgi:hypothetical protein